MSRYYALGAIAAPLLLVFACSDLKKADDAPADGGDTADGDVSTNPDGSSGGDAIADADPDVGQPPSDTECSTDAWTKTTKASADCAQRQTFVIDDAPFDPQGISITRTSTGRVGVVFASFTGGPDESELHLVHFVPTSAAAFADGGTGKPALVTLDLGLGTLTGAATKIAAEAPDTLVVLSHDPGDYAGPGKSGDVVLRKLVNGTGALAPGGAVATGVRHPTQLGFSIDSAGTLVATVMVTTATGDAGTAGKIMAYRKIGAGALSPLPDLTSGLQLGIPGAGETSLFATPSNQLHALYHYTASSAFTFMKHHTLDTSAWSAQKSVESTAGNGVYGYSPNVRAYGTRKIVTYVARKAGQAPPATADLKIARWQAQLDTPIYETLDANLYATDTTFPHCRVAAAIDKYGLEHVVYFAPTSATAGPLVYRRQTRTANGDLTWLVDTIDPDALDGQNQPWVDLYVDDNARPHIAYISGKDGKVRYATRFDR
jgi:hypothetical protein